MRVLCFGLLSLTLAACGRPPEIPTRGIDLVGAEKGTTYRWSFDPAPHFAPSPPSPIQSTESRTRFLAVLGKWRIERDDSAPSAPYVMRQERADGHAARVLVEQLGFRGVAARTKCRIDGAREDASCGVIFSAYAEDDYFVARVEDSGVRLVHVTGPVETELATSSTKIARGSWHEVSVWARGGDVFVDLDGAVALSAKITTDDLGRIGLFARGDASFDDLAATALDRTDVVF